MPAALTPEAFLQQSGADAIIEDFKQWLAANNKTLTVSDVTDEAGHQYVDLVQEGGGVLGIALVGYTYVLEKMGIRFFSLAGTSAGSINAMLLACSGNKEEEKSTTLVKHLVQLDMFSFVDGKKDNWAFTRWIKRVLQKMLFGGPVVKRLLRFIKVSLLVLTICSMACFIANFFNPLLAQWLGVAAGVLLSLLVILLLLGLVRFRQFARNGYGLNSGDTFHRWIKQLIGSNFIENNTANGPITNMDDFSRHFMRVPPLTVKEDPRRNNNNPPHMPMLTIITCDIIAERKIEFPQMWDLYWSRPQDVHPGDFVRASMSIPIFFESFSIKDIRKKSSFAAWSNHLDWQNQSSQIPDTSQFIDGGVLSNFPINLFYNPNYPVPRMPTFGIRLQDGLLDGADRSNDTFWSYAASLFSTIRFNFDRDFITKNRAYTMGVKSIDVNEHSWLNFFMEDAEKIQLFRKGARAAVEFLKSFDWELYKSERLNNFELAKEVEENPNNLEVFPFSDTTTGTA